MANLSDIRGAGRTDADGTGTSVPRQTGPSAEYRATDSDLLEEVDDLLAELLLRLAQLPEQMRGAIRAELVELRGELDEPSRDRARTGARLCALKSALSIAPPLAEMVQDVAYLVAELTG